MLTVYGVPGSPYVRMPLIACEEKGVAWRLHRLALGENRSEAHLRRHPFGKVPAIEHEGWRLYETQAILRNIDAAFPGPSLTPAAPRAMARMSQTMNIVDCYAAPSLSAELGWNLVVAPMFGLPGDREAALAALPRCRQALEALDDLLGEQPFFCGDALSLADVMVAPHLDFTPMSPEGRRLLDETPRLVAWLDRVRRRPSFAATAWQALAPERDVA